MTKQNYESAIAIIGMACRFPGANTINAFWRNLCEGVESITFFPEENRPWGVSDARLANPNYVRAGATIDDIELFDNAFFGLNPKESEIMDPQHRLFLELGWQVLEDAGYAPGSIDGRVGVYGGCNLSTYLLSNLWSNPSIIESVGDFSILIGNDKDYLTTRVSSMLNLKGPSVAVQTACSTSLVAVHLGCQSLLDHECDMAITGGVSISVPQDAGYLYQKDSILSPDGHCRSFDAKGKGTVIGNGAGVVLLKRLEEALSSGDQIHAVIRGSAINNDGAQKVGYTAPSVAGQAAVIAEALALGEVGAETVSYIEAHGTATALGDPIEVEALTQVFRAATERRQFCALGSVKSNFGHLLSAAGIAGLIKTVLALKHKQIPASLHYEEANPQIKFETTPFYVNTELREWRVPAGLRRRAGVSSFGIGGTNAHVVLEEAPEPEAREGSERGPALLLVSARSESGLGAAAMNLARALESEADLKLADVAYTLAVGRREFNWRQAVVGETVGGVVAQLRAVAGRRAVGRRPVVLLFPGQGAQYVGMGEELYRRGGEYREVFERCSAIVKEESGVELEAVLYPAGAGEAGGEWRERLRQTGVTQPAVFVVSYALARQWQAWGVKAAAVLGHSLGEYVGAVLSGVLSEAEGVRLVTRRARLMESCAAGAMLSVGLSEAETEGLLEPGLSVAAINGAKQVVVSGEVAAVERLAQELKGQGVTSIRLETSHGFHSALMEGIAAEFAEELERVQWREPELPYVSSLTGQLVSANEVTQVGYWLRQMREPVRFSAGVAAAAAVSEGAVLLEVGPGQGLSRLARRELGGEVVTLASLGSERGGEWERLLKTMGRLWEAGVELEWRQVYAGQDRRRVTLPTYPFERQRFWIDEEKGEVSDVHEKQRTVLDRENDISRWFFIPSWQRTLPPSEFKADMLGGKDGAWLVFVDEAGLGSVLVQRLEQLNQSVVTVSSGPEFLRESDRGFILNPGDRAHYESLVKELRDTGWLPHTIAHLWNVTAEAPTLDFDTVDQMQGKSFYSLLHLTQALGKYNITQQLRLGVISNHIHRIAGEQQLCPQKATTLGLCKVIPQEYPNIDCSSIDIALPPGSPARSKLIDRLLVELSQESRDPVVAYRGHDRWKQQYERVSIEANGQEPAVLKNEGVYLITGGFGGIGLVLAEYLAQTVKAKLIITSRSDFPPRSDWHRLSSNGASGELKRRITKIRQLESQGAEILPIAADTADEAQMRAALEQGQKQFGPINGVIHCAGLPGGGMIQGKTREIAEGVLAPKVKGTVVLASLLAGQQLDFFVLCSSLATIRGGLGQADYCSANSFLDAFAQYSTARSGAPVTAINWGAWAEVGMALETVTQRGYLPCPLWLSTRLRTDDRGHMVHPLVHTIVREAADERAYLSEFNPATQWVLSEHKVMGAATLPGTAYLEMVRAGFVDLTQAATMKMRDVSFLAPLMINDGTVKEVHTMFERNGDEFEFRVTSKHEPGDGQEALLQEHLRGKIHAAANGTQQYELQKLLGRCEEISLSSESFETQKQTKLIDFGPRWNGLKKLYKGTGEGVALVELPEAFVADLQEFKLHPALLDMAVGFGKEIAGVTGNYLPLAYGQIAIHAPLPRRIYSHIKSSPGNTDSAKPVLQFDVTIMDETGKLLVEVRDYTLRRLSDVAMHLKGLSGEAYGKVAANESLLSGAILSSEGVEAFRRVLAHGDLAQVVISPMDVPSLISKWKPQGGAFIGQFAKLQLPKVGHARPDTGTPYQAPTNEIESMIANIWQSLLGIEEIGIRDDFFALGGDSLMGIQVVSHLREAFHVELSPAILFERPTIAELSESILQILGEQVNAEMLAEIDQLHE